MSDVSVPVWAVVAAAAVAVVLVLLVGVVLLVALTGRTRAERRLTRAAESEAELRERLESLEKRLTTPSRRRQRAREEREYVITSLGEQADADGASEQTEVRTLTAPAFADAVFRETMVHSAAFVHGVRRALSPEVRYRIRYEMKREVKRARKDRKSEVREALRAYRAQQRDDLDDGVGQGPGPRHRADVGDLQEESR